MELEQVQGLLVCGVDQNDTKLKSWFRTYVLNNYSFNQDIQSGKLHKGKEETDSKDVIIHVWFVIASIGISDPTQGLHSFDIAFQFPGCIALNAQLPTTTTFHENSVLKVQLKPSTFDYKDSKG